MRIVIILLCITKWCVGDDKCGVIPIRQWDKDPLLRQEKLPCPVKLVIVQHTATPECRTDEQCESIARQIRYYHRHEKGFIDVGQSFLIGGNGRVYEGSGWDIVGAHTQGYNNRSIGISFIGNFMTKLPTYKALQAALDLLSCGVIEKHLSQNYQVVGHRQLSRTASPGTALQAEIEIWPHWARNIDV